MIAHVYQVGGPGLRCLPLYLYFVAKTMKPVGPSWKENYKIIRSPKMVRNFEIRFATSTDSQQQRFEMSTSSWPALGLSVVVLFLSVF